MTDPFDRPARPWDLFNKNLGRVEADVADARMELCRQCPELEHRAPGVDQCKQCGCIMNAKTKLPNASCPLGKWAVVRVSYKEDTNV